MPAREVSRAHLTNTAPPFPPLLSQVDALHHTGFSGHQPLGHMAQGTPIGLTFSIEEGYA